MAEDYLTPLSIPDGSSGEYSIRRFSYPAGHVFELAHLEHRILGRQESGKVSWPHATYWHELNQGGVRWMLDTPHEQAQHYKSLHGFRGDVLVAGLGIGFAASVLAMRPEVNSVTVVEVSKDVIRLVAPHVREPHKIKVVNNDAMAFLRDQKCHFDFAFFDIWINQTAEVLTDVVCPLRELARGKVSHTPTCWNEDVMRGDVRRKLGLLRSEREHPGIYTPTPMPLWASPFFSWHDKAKPTIGDSANAIEFYSSILGLTGWGDRWIDFCSNFTDRN